MKIYWTDDFKGYYPVGVAAIVIEENELAARIRLNNELIGIGLEGLRQDSMLYEVPFEPKAIVINDGNY